MKFSVIVCTYNASEEDLAFTLNTIINQSLDEYEIVICDDGSCNNNELFLREYFEKNKFFNYTLVLNEENKGTVKNLISGLEYAKGELVKPIGTGDALVDRNVLSNVYDEMKQKNSKCLFTDMRIFSVDNAKRKYHDDIRIPLKITDYAKQSYDKMKENIIVYNDHISGASMFYDRKYILEQLNIIQKSVVYMEDLVQYLVLLSGEQIHYLDMKCVDYEIGTGISTLKNSKNNGRMKKDKDCFLEYIFEAFSQDTAIVRRKRIETIEQKYNNKLIKGILKAISEPGWIYFRLHRR